MIPAALDRCIVEICADASSSLGTGFLVSNDRLILTARHVGAGRPSVKVRFPGAALVDAALVEEDASPDRDWALYRAAAVPPGVEPMPAGRLGNLAAEVKWYSIGYANLRGGERGGFLGEVRSTVPTLELYCQEFVGRFYDDARGLSGGPCIVDGEAVALIVDVTYRLADQLIVAGQVRALPLAQIKPQMVELALGTGPQLPWEEVFTGWVHKLSPPHRKIAAGQVGYADPIEGDSLPRQIARRMINQGILGVAKVLEQLHKEFGAEVRDQMFGLAQTLWVSGSAAECLAALMQEKRLCMLTTDCDWSAEHHLSRAFSARRPGAVAWPHVLLNVAGAQEPFADSVVEQAYKTLGEAFRLKSRQLIKQSVELRAPVTAFVACVPRQDIAERLRKEFPTLVILFMSRVRPSGHTPTIPTITLDEVIPAPTPEEESQAADLIDIARGLLP